MGDSGYHNLVSIKRKPVTEKQIKESENFYRKIDQKLPVVTFEGTKEEMEKAKETYLYGLKVKLKQGRRK